MIGKPQTRYHSAYDPFHPSSKVTIGVLRHFLETLPEHFVDDDVVEIDYDPVMMCDRLMVVKRD